MNRGAFAMRCSAARVRSRQALAAYLEVEPKAATFDELAAVCVQEKAADQLQILLDAQRKENPDNIDIPRWNLELRLLKQDYDGVLKLLGEEDQDIFRRAYERWKIDDYRVRCLVKLKRTDEAIREAEALVGAAAIACCWSWPTPPPAM